MSVINLDDHRPHREGQAKCAHCRHTWHAVAPVDAGNLECPECGLCKGVWYGVHMVPEGEEHFECQCGNSFFELSKSGPLCIDCGEKFTWDSVS